MNARQLWQAALADLETQVSRTGFETWVRPAAAVSFDGEAFVLAAPSSFARDWLESHLLPEVGRSLARVVGRPVQVRIVTGVGSQVSGDGDEAAGVGTSESGALGAGPDARGRRAGTRRRGAGTERRDSVGGAEEQTAGALALSSDPRSSIPDAQPPTPDTWHPTPAWSPSPRYTFDTFVVGSSNQLAHAAALSVAERPGRSYNPLFIYGGVGLGKTHLLHAIAHVAIAAGARTLYVPSETFTNELVEAIRVRGRTDDFRNRYRNVDCLLVDDVQFIAGKEATQEEFFHTFNALHGAGRQVVLSSDRPPRAMATLEGRLRSRFEWGLIADVQPPDLETRMAILRQKAEEQPVAVPPEVIAFLAQRIQSNIRELEGALNRVVAHARLAGQPLNPVTAAAALSDLLANPARRFIDPGRVVDAVCRYYRVEPRLLRGKGRDREVVLPRQVAMYVMRQETEASLLEIGRELGGKDHSTVLHGVNKVQSEIEADAQLRKDVLAIRELLYAEARP